MLIIGAKGFAKELLEICKQNDEVNNLMFYDDINQDIGDYLYDTFPVVKKIEEAKIFFETTDNRFILGLGDPVLRFKMYNLFSSIGGNLVSTISKYSEIGSYGVELANGVNILGGVRISNNVIIGKGSMIYYNSIITHDVEIGDFVEVSPGVTLLGNVKIKNNVKIGAGSIILPNVIIEENSIIGAGTVVLKDIPKNSLAIGVPAKIVKQF